MKGHENNRVEEKPRDQPERSLKTLIGRLTCSMIQRGPLNFGIGAYCKMCQCYRKRINTTTIPTTTGSGSQVELLDLPADQVPKVGKEPNLRSRKMPGFR